MAIRSKRMQIHVSETIFFFSVYPVRNERYRIVNFLVSMVLVIGECIPVISYLLWFRMLVSSLPTGKEKIRVIWDDLYLSLDVEIKVSVSV